MNSTGTVIAIAPNMHQFIQAVPILGIINTDRNSNMGIIPNQNRAPVTSPSGTGKLFSQTSSQNNGVGTHTERFSKIYVAYNRGIDRGMIWI